MNIMKRLLHRLGMFFSKKKHESEPEPEEELDVVGEISFFIDKDANTFVTCSWKEDSNLKNLFAELYINVNCGTFSSDILEIIYDQCKEEEKIAEYTDLLARITELYQLHLTQEIDVSKQEQQKENSTPLIKPTEVIEREGEGGDLF